MNRAGHIKYILHAMIFFLFSSVLLLSLSAEENGITKYKSMHQVEYSVGDLTPTICTLWDVKSPRKCVCTPIQPVLDLAKKQFVGKKQAERTLVFCPDAIGDFLVPKYSADFKPLQSASDFIMKGSNVMPSVTPVCFSTIFTGMPPEVHGITKYMRPVLKAETLFDVFVKNKKNVAIIAVNNCSIDLIFRERSIDYYSFRSNEASFQFTKKLLEAEPDAYDLIISYDGGYDSAMHKNGVDAAPSVQAMRDSISRYLELVQTTDRVWSKYNRVTVFAPDHGAHDDSRGKGKHGTEDADDMIVDHYYRLRGGK